MRIRITESTQEGGNPGTFQPLIDLYEHVEAKDGVTAQQLLGEEIIRLSKEKAVLMAGYTTGMNRPDLRVFAHYIKEGISYVREIGPHWRLRRAYDAVSRRSGHDESPEMRVVVLVLVPHSCPPQHKHNFIHSIIYTNFVAPESPEVLEMLQETGLTVTTDLKS